MTEFQSVASIIAAIAATISVIVSLVNSQKIQHLHVQINSRMDEWIKLTRDSALAQGRLEGVAQEREDQKNC